MKTDLTLPTEEELEEKMPDKDGYPTKEELNIIKNWDVITQGWFGLVDYLEKIWWAADWGFCRNDNARDSIWHKKALKFELHTGGWSGNEEIIATLKSNFIFWNLSWLMTRVGGHYYFEIPYSREEEFKREKVVTHKND